MSQFETAFRALYLASIPFGLEKYSFEIDTIGRGSDLRNLEGCVVLSMHRKRDGTIFPYLIQNCTRSAEEIASEAIGRWKAVKKGAKSKAAIG